MLLMVAGKYGSYQATKKIVKYSLKKDIELEKQDKIPIAVCSKLNWTYHVNHEHISVKCFAQMT